MYIKANSNYLAHHGIKGQKWGVRRYQNEKGSYTKAGRSHYRIGQKIANTGRKIRDYMTVKGDDGKRHLSEKGKKAVMYSLIGIGAISVAAIAASTIKHYSNIINDQTIMNSKIDSLSKKVGLSSNENDEFKKFAYDFFKPKLHGSFREL